jgi:GTP cyclohydrolase II
VKLTDLESAAASMITVDRAVGDLRRGEFVLLEGAGGVALAQAAETLSPQSLATFTRLANGRASLALTARRASALELPKTAAAPAPASGVESGDSFAAAAVTLSKLAQLLPAAVTAALAPAEVAQTEWFASHRHLLRVAVDAIADYARLAAVTLQPVSEARVPLAAAEDARVIGFRPADGSAEQFAIVVGEPAAHQPALCRVHSECFTGDLLGSLRCDCGAQLQQALALMGVAGHGVLLYLAHEGRGIGLINKLRAYQLQDAGLDTLDANQHLGFEPDERNYRAAAVMLRHLGIQSVRLLTNNPVKVEALSREGIEVVERVTHAVAPNRHNHGYLTTKARRAGHLLEG